MAAKTNIAWASFTASPWFGCTEVSSGCVNCYARELTLQHKWAGWGDKSPRVRSKGFWKDAYKWDRVAGEYPYLCATCNAPLKGPEKVGCHRDVVPNRPRIFTSLMDWLDPQVPIEWLVDFLKVVHDCQNLDWLLLTKRPENWHRRIYTAMDIAIGNATMNAFWLAEWMNGTPPANVWFGVTVENQAMADKRIPQLLSIPARVRWLSVEPLLEPIHIRKSIHPAHIEGNVALTGINWVVVGGESGKNRRDPGVKPIIDVAQQCLAAHVPVFVKQDCGMLPGTQGRIPDEYWNLKQYPT